VSGEKREERRVGDFIKVLYAKPWSLTLYGLRHVPAQPAIYVAKDKVCRRHLGRVLLQQQPAAMIMPVATMR